MKRRAVKATWAIISMVALLVVLAPVIQAPVSPLPSFAEVKTAYRPSERVVKDRHGEAIAAVRIDYTERRGDWVALDQVSPAMLDAVQLSEDRRFYEHKGVDWRAFTAAGWNWIWGKNSRGASTLSMQLVAMLDLNLQRPRGGRSVMQKLQQMRQAHRLEAAWSKAHIFEAYLNLVAFRGELRGLDAVSRVMFGKHPHGLDLREAAVAAALLRGPNAESERVALRACGLLQEMASGEFCAGLSEQVGTWLAATALPAADTPALAPHFARWALAQSAQQSQQPNHFITTLDADLQRVVRASIQRHLAGMGEAHLTDAAVVVLHNRSGEVLAYVGSSGGMSQAEEVDHARARRQAGSTLKPFLYAQALQLRYLTAASLLDDSPLNVATVGGLYIPQNYDRHHVGLVSARIALASSLNIPAVRVLMLVGPERFAQQLRDLGLPLRHDGDHYGYSLSLGSADVDLLSLTNAYRTLANGGRWSEPKAFLDRSSAEYSGKQRVDEMAAWVVGDMLSDRRARSRSFGLENALTTRFWSAVKTGTSKDMRDNWTLGWSDTYTVGVWVGNSQGLSMREVSGITGAAPIWHEVMSYLHKHQGSRQPPPPDLLERQRVSFQNQLEAPRIEYFLPGTAIRQVEAISPGSVQRARIVSPAAGTIIAFDPDMPIENQRLVLRAAGGVQTHALEWQVDGVGLGRGQKALWLPQPGRHRILLLDSAGQVQDEIDIQVRGLPSISQLN